MFRLGLEKYPLGLFFRLDQPALSLGGAFHLFVSRHRELPLLSNEIINAVLKKYDALGSGQRCVHLKRLNAI